MGAAAGQIPDEPRVHIAEQQLAALGTLARTRNVIEDPLDLRAGKIGVDEQAGLLLHIRAKTVGRELIADGRRAAALPDDRVIDGLARVLVPDDRRLALVRDADAAMSVGDRPLFSNASLMASIWLSRMTIGSCSTQPGFG